MSRARPAADAAAAPPSVVVRNVAVAPYAWQWAGGPDIRAIPAHGRILRGPGRTPVDTCAVEAGAEAGARRIEGSFLYGGPFLDHFGHVMMESIVRLWAYDPRAHPDGVVFAAAARSAEPPAYFRDVLWVFGIEPHRVRVIGEPSVVDELHFAPPGSILQGGPEPWYLARLPGMEERALSRSRPDLPVHDRVYLGRGHILGRGTLIGESFFAAELTRGGYVPVRPEALPVFDQLRLLKAAREIVFMEGSAISAAELAASLPGRVRMIRRREEGGRNFTPHLAPRCDFAVLGVDARIVRQPSRKGKRGPAAPSFAVDPRPVLRDLAGEGLLRRRRFSWKTYRMMERADARGYFRSARKTAARLAEIEALRTEAGLPAPGIRALLKRLLVRLRLRAPS